MGTDDMINDLTKQLDTLRNELLDMERAFTMKKEQFLKIQGALEALNAVKLNANSPFCKSLKVGLLLLTEDLFNLYGVAI